jgi:hypothetical protein
MNESSYSPIINEALPIWVAERILARRELRVYSFLKTAIEGAADGKCLKNKSGVKTGAGLRGLEQIFEVYGLV